MTDKETPKTSTLESDVRETFQELNVKEKDQKSSEKSSSPKFSLKNIFKKVIPKSRAARIGLTTLTSLLVAGTVLYSVYKPFQDIVQPVTDLVNVGIVTGKINKTYSMEFPNYNISSDLVVSKGIYYVKKPILVRTNAQLTIAAGTSIYFKNDTYMDIEGILLADGSDQDPILFSSGEDFNHLNQNWNGLVFSNEVSKFSSLLDYCTIENACSSKTDRSAAITIDRAEVRIYNFSIKNNKSINGSIISVNNGSLEMIESRIVDSELWYSGTTVLVDSSLIRFDKVKLTDNHLHSRYNPSVYGHTVEGVINTSHSDGFIKNSVVIDNSCSNCSAGLVLRNSTIELLNNDIINDCGEGLGVKWH